MVLIDASVEKDQNIYTVSVSSVYFHKQMIQSYQGSQIFEAIGIRKEVIDTYFTNTVSRIGGITLKDIERDMNTWHMRAFDPLGLDVDLSLDSIGGHKMRSGKEEHLYNARTIHLLQESTKRGDYEMFKEYSHNMYQ